MKEYERWVLHCDCNSFYASVELLDHPELQNVPVAVCGDAESRHGIILAKNEAAKKFGVQTAETIWQAKQKCPTLQFLSAHHEKYHKFYTLINKIYCEYTARVEPFSIDESWLDISQVWHLYAASPKELGDIIRQRVKAETGVTISVGVSYNKIFAKMASDYKKPNATTLITKQNYKDILWPMPCAEMFSVGKRTAEKLMGLGYKTIGDLATETPERLVVILGKAGLDLSQNVRGENKSEVRRWGEKEPIKSIGNGTTFKRNLISDLDIRTGLTHLSQEVASRLRAHKLYAGAVQITIKDIELKSITRQKQLPYSSHIASELADVSYELLRANWAVNKPIRMLTITALNLTDAPFAVQQSFFDDTPKPSPKKEALEQSLDKIRDKYGKRSVANANIIKNDLGLEELNIKKEN